MDVISVGVDEVIVGEGRRPLSEETVIRLMESIKEIGLRTPITVRYSPPDEAFILVAGAHRLEVARRLDWSIIDAFEVDDSDIDAEMWEIAENLHRAELTALQHDQQVARWVELVEAKGVSAQVGPKPQGGRPESGVRRASRELGIARSNVQRAVKVASLSDEAKQAATDAGLDDNRSVLLKAAREAPEKQAEVIRQEAAARAEPKPTKIADYPLNDLESKEKQVAMLMSAWNRAGPEAREEFLSRIDRPVMDRRYG